MYSQREIRHKLKLYTIIEVLREVGVDYRVYLKEMRAKRIKPPSIKIKDSTKRFYNEASKQELVDYMKAYKKAHEKPAPIFFDDIELKDILEE